MDIYNRGKLIAKKAKLCDNIISSSLGLMFSKPKVAVLKASIESINLTTIHTVFMRFPIDVIWLDRGLKIVDIRRNVKPYRFPIAPRKKSMYVIELPAQKELAVNIGDKLKFSI